MNFEHGLQTGVGERFVGTIFDDLEIRRPPAAVNRKDQPRRADADQIAVPPDVIIPSRTDCIVKLFLITAQRRAHGID